MFSLMGTTKQLKTPLWEKFRPDTLYPKGGYEAGYIANLCFTFFSSRKPYVAVPFGQPGAATRVRPGTVHVSVQIFDFGHR